MYPQPHFAGTPARNAVHNCDALTLLKAMPSGSVDAIVTDPPYRMTKRGNSSRPNWMYDNMTENLFGGDLPDTHQWMTEAYRVLKDGTHFYTFVSINDITQYLIIAQEVGFKLHNIINMLKDTHTPNQWYMKYCEPALFFRKGQARPINDPRSRDYFRVEMPKLSNGKMHITEKPLGFMSHLVRNSTNEGDLVVDCFAGSGTTLLAAANLGRQYIGCDISAAYCEIARKRLAQPYTLPLFAEVASA